MGKLLALHVAGHHHGSLRRVEEHRGGVKCCRGADGLDPLKHVLLVGGRKDKMAATAGVHLKLMPESTGYVLSMQENAIKSVCIMICTDSL